MYVTMIVTPPRTKAHHATKGMFMQLQHYFGTLQLPHRQLWCACNRRDSAALCHVPSQHATCRRHAQDVTSSAKWRWHWASGIHMLQLAAT